MQVRRSYEGWDPADPLDPQAESVLGFLERLAGSGRLSAADDLNAQIDEYGVVTAEVGVRGGRELFLQAGDGWDRVLWTCPSGRTFEWIWCERETPRDLEALVDGRGVERTTLLRTGRVAVELVVDGRTVAIEGRLRLALLRRLRIRLHEKDEAAL